MSLGAASIRELAPADPFSLEGTVAVVTGAGGYVSLWIMIRVPMKRPGAPAELVGTCRLLASRGGLVHHRPDVHRRRRLHADGRWFKADE